MGVGPGRASVGTGKECYFGKKGQRPVLRIKKSVSPGQTRGMGWCGRLAPSFLLWGAGSICRLKGSVMKDSGATPKNLIGWLKFWRGERMFFPETDPGDWGTSPETGGRPPETGGRPQRVVAGTSGVRRGAPLRGKIAPGSFGHDVRKKQRQKHCVFVPGSQCRPELFWGPLGPGPPGPRRSPAGGRPAGPCTPRGVWGAEPPSVGFSSSNVGSKLPEASCPRRTSLLR